MEQAKNVADVLSLSTAIASLAGALPVIASTLSIIWLSIRIYEYIRCKNVDDPSNE